MTQHEDLADRLRNLGAWLDEECRSGSAETATEAADALEAQAREIAALKEQEAQRVWEACKHYGKVGEIIYTTYKAQSDSAIAAKGAQ